MGHRLSKIYTKTGDKGTTGLADGKRIDKDDILIECIGSIDELNSAIGVVLTDPILPNDISACLSQIQHELFDMGGELSLPKHQAITSKHVKNLEYFLDKFNENLEPLKEFILPGGNIPAAHCHFARSICRRAERNMVKLQKQHKINSQILIYLNRLSDLLFVLARSINHAEHVAEIVWKHERKK